MALTQIKICGLTREEDVARAAGLGADLFGFIHVPKSPRYVPIDRLPSLLNQVPADCKRVIVVQDTNPDQLTAMSRELTFDYFQFHGAEDAALVNRFPGYKVIHVQEDRWDQQASASYDGLVMFDTQVGHLRGGSGRTFQWEILRNETRPFLVAGGLNPDNVGPLVRDLKPWGVDVSSGVEHAPGIKNHQAMAQFITQVRSAES